MMQIKRVIVLALLLGAAPVAFACRITLTNDTGQTYAVKEETGEDHAWHDVAPGGQAVVGSHHHMPTFQIKSGDTHKKVVQIACGDESAGKEKAYRLSEIINNQLPAAMFTIEHVQGVATMGTVVSQPAPAGGESHSGCGCKH